MSFRADLKAAAPAAIKRELIELRDAETDPRKKRVLRHGIVRIEALERRLDEIRKWCDE